MRSEDMRLPEPDSILSPEMLSNLSSVGLMRSYGSGDIIFRFGDPGDEMFIVEDGEIGLLFEEGKSGKLLSRGAFFGELALFSRHRLRTATAVATRETKLRILDQTTFNVLLQEYSELLARLLLQTCAYLVESEQNLVSDLQKRNRELEQTLDYLRRTRRELDSAELLLQTDVLTGLYNRRCLERQVGVVLPRANERAMGLSLIIMDVDHFKSINDSYGHHVGDVVLRRFADQLKNSVRRSDIPCRLGGDEFAVLLSGIETDSVVSTVTQIFNAVSSLDITLPHVELKVTASMGGATYREEEGWDAFFNRADQNLYLAKQSGRHRLGWNGKAISV